MKPLAGLRIVITRDQRGSEEFAALLESLGAEPRIAPLIELMPPDDMGALEQAVRDVESYDWILFTSPNAVRFFFAAGAAPQGPRICAIGPATRSAIEERGLTVALMPSNYIAEGVVAAFASQDLARKRILLPRASVARDLVPDALTAQGAHVDVVEVYRNRLPEQAAEDLRVALEGPPDWITFASSSAVKNCLACVDRSALAGIRTVSIGPATSRVLRMHGLAVDAEAIEHTLDGMAAAIAVCRSNSTTEPSIGE